MMEENDLGVSKLSRKVEMIKDILEEKDIPKDILEEDEESEDDEEDDEEQDEGYDEDDEEDEEFERELEELRARMERERETDYYGGGFRMRMMEMAIMCATHDAVSKYLTKNGS